MLLNKKRENNQYTLPSAGMYQYKWDRPPVLVKLPPLFTDRMEELKWTLAPSQCWLCRRLSGDALRQNLFFYLIILDPSCKTPVWCFETPDTSIQSLHLSTGSARHEAPVSETLIWSKKVGRKRVLWKITGEGNPNSFRIFLAHLRQAV